MPRLDNYEQRLSPTCQPTLVILALTSTKTYSGNLNQNVDISGNLELLATACLGKRGHMAL